MIVGNTILDASTSSLWLSYRHPKPTTSGFFESHIGPDKSILSLILIMSSTGLPLIDHLRFVTLKETQSNSSNSLKLSAAQKEIDAFLSCAFIVGLLHKNRMLYNHQAAVALEVSKNCISQHQTSRPTYLRWKRFYSISEIGV